MFEYLRGILDFKSHDFAVIDVNGAGFRLTISHSTYQLLPDIGEEVKLSTYMAVREDNISLYGFFSPEEKRIFEQLISVSGIGPKVGIGVLSDITPADFSLAVITDDVNRLTKISGIGKKTAQRIIIELKDKLKTEDAIIDSNVTTQNIALTDDVNEAISALQVLGYPNKDAVSMVNSIYKDGMKVEEIVRLALKNK